jgi:hypothetical protein
MRHLMALAFFFLLASAQVHACRGLSSQDELFFKDIPNPQPDANVIAEVSVLDVSDFGVSTAKVLQVFNTSDERVYPGSIITMKYGISSCGPNPISGTRGTIIAKAGTDNKGNLVLYPYTNRRGDGHISAPTPLSDDFFKWRPQHLRIGKSVPQDFSVMLIGVTGTTSVYSLKLDHSEGREIIRLEQQSNTIIAIAIPPGIKKPRIYSANIILRGKVYHLKEVRMHTLKPNISQPGLYYVATLNADHPGLLQKSPLSEQLKKFRADYASTTEKLEPINFKWPRQ